jgi:hypothetical protein
MRSLPLALMILFIFVAIAVVRPAAASGLPGPRAYAGALPAATPPRPVNQHDDSRIGVQLVVAGIAAGLVVGVGTGAYLLRRKLGLTAYVPPETGGGGHH